MERILTYTISDSEHHLRVEQFLRRKRYSRQNLTELKKMYNSVLLNGIWVHMNDILSVGDTLTVHIQENTSSEHIPPTELPLDICYEDEDIIVVNKPAVMPIHPSLNHYYISLANALAWYYKQQNKSFIFRCTNRLDRDTSGLTVVAKHMLSASILSQMTVQHEIYREYLAVVRGSVSPSCGTIDAPLIRKSGSIIERAVDFENGERAVTHYQTIEGKNGHSLVSLVLETGRTHQIRIHMKHIGFPLVGDYLYNPDMEFITRQALHSHKLRFSHPITGKMMEFTAPLPDDMRRILYPIS